MSESNILHCNNVCGTPEPVRIGPRSYPEPFASAQLSSKLQELRSKYLKTLPDIPPQARPNLSKLLKTPRVQHTNVRELRTKSCSSVDQMGPTSKGGGTQISKNFARNPGRSMPRNARNWLAQLSFCIAIRVYSDQFGSSASLFLAIWRSYF